MVEKVIMRTLRRLLTGAAVLATMAVGVASADNIVSYTVTIAMQPTDLTNVLAMLPGWCPGCISSPEDSIGSTAEPAGYGPGGTIPMGVTMASLAPTDTLQGYDILVTSIVTGNYTISNSATASSNATGSAHLDSYTAVSLGNQLSPALNNVGNQEPTNDLFYNPNNPDGYGYGPDPATSTTGFNLAPGTSTTVSFTSLTKTADVGCDFFPNTNNAPCSNYNEINPPNSLSNINVEAPALNFYVSTSTETLAAFSNGNASISDSTQVKERITVTYDYTTSVVPSVPEPVTMILMGGALVGLGLVGKHLKKS